MVVHQRRGPAVGHASGERERARLRGAEPDADLVRRLGAEPRAIEPVVAAVEAQRAGVAPARTQDRDRLLERLEALPGGQLRGAHRARGVEEAAAAEAGLEAPAAEQVERRRRLREHRRRAQRQVSDVLEDADPLGLAEDHAEQRQRVEVRRLVGVVLDAEQVVAELVGQARRLEHPVGVARVRDQEVAELYVVAVIGHRARAWRLAG